MKPPKPQAFTLIELLVVISIIAILAGIALPVFGEVTIRGNQTKALSNAKQVGLACKLYAGDYQGNFPHYASKPDATGVQTAAKAGDESNKVLETLIPDYLPDKGVFSIPKSAYCKVKATPGKADELLGGENEWAYVLGLNETSNSRYPFLADGFTSATDLSYNGEESKPGGVWKGKKAVVVRVDISGTVETCFQTGAGAARKGIVKRTETPPFTNAFEMQAATATEAAWVVGDTDHPVLNPTVP